MGIDTKSNLSNNKFEQYSGETLDLSGCTDIYGRLRITNDGTLSILPNAGVGKVLTSDILGIATWQDMEVSASGEKISKYITQSSHGFNVQDIIGWSGGTYNLAIADGTYDGEVIGIVTNSDNPNIFEVTQAGYITGLTGLVVGTTYFLSDTTAGLLTSVEPTGDTHISKAMLIADTTSSGWVLPYAGYIITSGDSGGGTWGTITGTLSDQTDLQNTLDLKAPLIAPLFVTCIETPIIKITTGAAAGCVLTSDANGAASWETPSAAGLVWTGSTDNGIGTYSSSGTICSEPTLTYDGLDLEFANGQTRCISQADAPSSGTSHLQIMGANMSASGSAAGDIRIIAGCSTYSSAAIGGVAALCGGSGLASSNGSSIGGAVCVVAGCGYLDGSVGIACGGHSYLIAGDSCAPNICSKGGHACIRAGSTTGSTHSCGGVLYLYGGNSCTTSNPAGEMISIGGGVIIRGGCAYGLCGDIPDKYISAGGISILAGCAYATSGESHGGEIAIHAGCAFGTSTTSNCGGSICNVGGNGYSCGGNIQLWAGNALCYGKGGYVCIRGGCSKQCCGGDICINGGIGSCTGNLGGNVYIYGGCGCCGASGGTINICGGNSTTASLYGNVDIYAGNDLIIRACHGSGSGYAQLYYNSLAKLCTVTNGICLGTNCGFGTDWVATSDCRLKTGIIPISNALSVVSQLCGVCYKLCDDCENENRIGLIAQDVLPILPEIVSHSQPSENDIKYGITDDKLGIKYDKLTALLIEAVKELKKKVQSLELEIERIKTC